MSCRLITDSVSARLALGDALSASFRLGTWIAGACVGLALQVSAGPGYLTDGGPPPLRFQSPRLAPATSLLALPLPSQVTSSLPATVEPGQPAATVLSPPGPFDSAGVNTPASALETASPGSETAEPPATSALTIPTLISPAMGTSLTPQLLIPYFVGGEAGQVQPIVAAPISFIPPQPVGRPASKATYIVGP